MVEQAKVDTVKSNLPSWWQQLTPWNDFKIEETLNMHNGNVNLTVRQFWLDRVGATAALTDVSDVGASRPLSQTYQHAQEMLRYWDRIAGTGGMASKMNKIKQRYPKPHGRGLSPYGGVYVRTD